MFNEGVDIGPASQRRTEGVVRVALLVAAVTMVLLVVGVYISF